MNRAAMTTDPRAVAEVEISRASVAMCRHPEDRLSHECGVLRSSLRQMAEDSAEYRGMRVVASKGCYLAWLTFAGEPILVEYADEEAATEVQRVWINGQFVSAFDPWSDWQIEAWSDELAAKIETEQLAEVES